MKPNYAKMQSCLSLTDLELLLALVRGGTLAGAAERLRLDTSTVFRSIKRLEQSLNERLFERSKQGYLPTELALELAAYAERIETHLNEARDTVSHNSGEPSGVVRITTTDTILQGLLLPVLNRFAAAYPKINLELLTSNTLANLSQRDADVAIRATKKPAENLVGLKLGVMDNAVYIRSSLLPRGRHQINLVAATLSKSDIKISLQQLDVGCRCNHQRLGRRRGAMFFDGWTPRCGNRRRTAGRIENGSMDTCTSGYPAFAAREIVV
jgi:DNA-binding transcriptional LysR family regulator